MSGTVRAQDIAPYRDSDPALFTGGVRVHSISKALGTEQMQINVLFFEPGARARPHSHEQDQVPLGRRLVAFLAFLAQGESLG